MERSLSHSMHCSSVHYNSSPQAQISQESLQKACTKEEKKTFSPPIHCTALEPACFVSFHVLQKKGHLSIHPAFFANGPSSSGAFSHRLLHKNGKRQATPNSSSNLLPLMPHAPGSLVQVLDSSRTMVRMEELPNFKDAVSL